MPLPSRERRKRRRCAPTAWCVPHISCLCLDASSTAPYRRCDKSETSLLRKEHRYGKSHCYFKAETRHVGRRFSEVLAHDACRHCQSYARHPTLCAVAHVAL